MCGAEHQCIPDRDGVGFIIGRLFQNDFNNFAPAIGFSWAPKFLGENKTVIRAGYGISYERNSLRLLDVLAGDQPGLRSVTTYTQTAIRIPISIPSISDASRRRAARA